MVRFAREGVHAVGGWRGEVNVPGLTQVRPDLLMQVSDGALGAGAHCIEFERSAVSPYDVEYKLGPYRRMGAAARKFRRPRAVSQTISRGRARPAAGARCRC